MNSFILCVQFFADVTATVNWLRQGRASDARSGQLHLLNVIISSGFGYVLVLYLYLVYILSCGYCDYSEKLRDRFLFRNNRWNRKTRLKRPKTTLFVDNDFPLSHHALTPIRLDKSKYACVLWGVRVYFAFSLQWIGVKNRLVISHLRRLCHRTELLTWTCWLIIIMSLQGIDVIDITRIVWGARVMKRYDVCPSVCPFVWPSSTGWQQHTRCWRFAAVGPAGRKYRSITACGSVMRRTNAGIATLSACVGSCTKTCCCYYYACWSSR